MKAFQKNLAELKSVSLDGTWDIDSSRALFQGHEFEQPEPQNDISLSDGVNSSPSKRKLTAAGTVIFGQPFQDGRIKLQVEFDEVDHRSVAGAILQYNPQTRDMLTFTVAGGGLPYEAGSSGYQFKLQSWGPKIDQSHPQRIDTPDRTKVWTTLFEVGLGSNLKANRPYNIEATVRGAIVTMQIDGVEIGKHELPTPSLSGFPCGMFCLSHSRVTFRDIAVDINPPKAFVVMQFQTSEYEALFKEVIEPVCKSEGLYAYRADYTYLPGLIIEDIKKQIAEARVIIAEITPQNPNVYYEVGYADALNKPVILISDRKEGLKPFDVRAYRTIFYDNSIGGKAQVESDLRTYLRSIMNT